MTTLHARLPVLPATYETVFTNQQFLEYYTLIKSCTQAFLDSGPIEMMLGIA